MWPFSKSQQVEKIPSTARVHLHGGGTDYVVYTELIADTQWVEFRVRGRLVALFPYREIQAVIVEEPK